jgi:outer membrane protein assembly factor BamB
MIRSVPAVGFRWAATVSLVSILSVTAVSEADTSGPLAESDLARRILDATGMNGGLIVHLGCGDGKLTAALHAGENYLIQGLDTDAEGVRQAREYVRQLGIYGPVSVEYFDGKRLPYAENLVNLIVAEDLGEVTMDEAMRVLGPGGAVYAKQDDQWTKTIKPRPEDIDEWTHYRHDAGGNPVAHDLRVGPPRYLQWSAEPRYTRSHEHIPSIYALVSTGGRIFYIADQAPIASIRRSPQWNLVARDACNGILLWKRPITTWFPHIVNWGVTPHQLQRKLVAAGDRVYVTLGLHAPLSAVDAATGDPLRVYENTLGAEEVVFHEGILLLVVRRVTEERIAELDKWAQLAEQDQSPLFARESAEPLVNRFRAIEARAEKVLLALDADSGRLLWKKEGADVAGLRTLTLSACEDGVFYQKGRDVVCLDLKTGQPRWSEASAPLRVVCQGRVFCADGKNVMALSAQTGETQWNQPTTLCQVRDVLVAGGSLWVGGFKPWQGRTTGKRGPAWGPYFVTQRDLATGRMLMHVEPENPGHHHRCYDNTATDRYLLAGRRGTEFIDLQSGDLRWHSWTRGVCKYGVMPCNGLLYVPPHACACYVAAKLTGFNALAAERRTNDEDPRTKEGGRLELGPAYGKVNVRPSSLPLRPSSDWPTYRADAARSGSTAAGVPRELTSAWQTELPGPLTAPVVADGRALVASVDSHTVHALDAATGKPLWSYTAGARVDSPPTIHQGQAIFGGCDGYVYSLRASDGELAWRLHAAGDEPLIAVRGQLESAAPVHGSVLIDGDVAYVTAGRSSYLDGGIDLYRVEPGTGKVLSRTPIYSPDPETGKQPDQYGPNAMPGARSDILSSDEGHVYLRDTVFGKDGAAQAEGSPHLFTLTDFLDDSWPHRSYWIFGTRCSIATGCSGRDKNLIYGRLLVFDESTIYGYGRKNVDWSNQLQDGPYRVFAKSRGEGTSQWETPLPIQVRAMVLTDKVLFVAGSPTDVGVGPSDGEEGRGAKLLAISVADGVRLAQYPLDGPPVFDGMAAAGGRLYLALENGRLVCLDKKAAP